MPHAKTTAPRAQLNPGPAMESSERGKPLTLFNHVSRWAVLSCLVYLFTAFTAGEVFPFSRFSMYASLDDRVHRHGDVSRSAVITARVNGKRVRPEDYHHFTGLDPALLIAPCGWANTMQYRVHEVSLWLRRHSRPRGSAEGPDVMEVGFLLIESRDGVHRTESWRPVTRGNAWPLF